MKRINFLIALFFMSVSIWAQDSGITGTVSENGTNFPLIGVTVTVKGKQLATSTNQDGKYALQANQGDELVFTYMGMEDITRTVGSEKIINVEMREDNVVLEQVVVIGYGTVKKSDLTGAVGSISAKDLQANIGTGAASALQGRMPGVSVTSQTGQPGSGMNINIRGVTSTNATTPLYVIDGVYGDINMIDPSDIESIEVLKDGSAAAIYGSRASAGVVLVTTKTGRKGMPSKISLNFYTGIQQLPKKVDLMNGEQWAEWMRTTGNKPDMYYSGKGTDWQEEVYRSAPVFKGNLGITGGSETSSYSTSMGYTSQEGIMVNTGYEAINLRMKTDFSFLNNRLKIGESILFKTSKQDLGQNSSLVGQVFKMPAVVPVRAEDGNWGTVESWMGNVTNPVTDLYVNSSGNTNHKKLTEVLINAYASLDIWNGFTYKANLGLTRDNGNNRAFKDAYDLGARAGSNTKPDLSESNFTINKWMAEHTLNYNQTFDKHTVYALAGYSAEKRTYKSVNAAGSDLALGVATVPGQGGRGDSFMEKNGTLSMFGRLMYSFDSRYMLSASVRRDGSSRFADGHRWGNFPSFSAGWNVHNEGFMSFLKPTFDELKLRASYGKLGNQEIGNYKTERLVRNGINYVEGTSWWQGGMPGINWVSPNDLSWETSETVNVGLDATLLKGKLVLTIDAYRATNKDLLMSVPMAPSAGLGGEPTMNAGTFVNRGIELGITHRNTVGDVFYTLTGSATFLRNRMTEITVGSRPEILGYSPRGLGHVTRGRIGRPISGYYLIKSDGIFQTDAEAAAYVDKSGNRIQPDAKAGDIRFVDANSDGRISVDDELYMGSGIPKTSLGFRANFEWKQFDLGLFFDAVMGNKLYNYNRWNMEAPDGLYNLGVRVLDSWSESNKGGRLPRYNGDPNNNKVYNDRWLEKGDFLRFKTLEIGYTLPRNILSKAKLDNVRVYTSIENLFTITAYKGYNPDMGAYDPYSGGAGSPLYIGVDEGRYPAARVMSLGIQVNL